MCTCARHMYMCVLVYKCIIFAELGIASYFVTKLRNVLLLK